MRVRTNLLLRCIIVGLLRIIKSLLHVYDLDFGPGHINMFNSQTFEKTCACDFPNIRDGVVVKRLNLLLNL